MRTRRLDVQSTLLLPGFLTEDPAFLTDQLLTYIGNKRALLSGIEDAVVQVSELVGRPLRSLDAFAGSGVVSRMLKKHSSLVISNDLEPYGKILAHCYLTNREDVPWERVSELVDEFNAMADDGASVQGFIEALYAPKDDSDIQPGERVFYTRDNARRLDLFAHLIGQVEPEIRPFLMGPLLSAASVHANTAGVFKGFYKDKETGIGRFGGAGEDALSRIQGKVKLRTPVTSASKSDFRAYAEPANDLILELDEVDLAYFDPPYNQHPYGSNYFMLNLLVNYEEPKVVSPVSGIPVDWRRSDFNVRKKSLPLMTDLVMNTKARFLLISFSDEGYIKPDAMLAMLEMAGSVSEFRSTYNAFRGSRNLQGRSIHVTEHLYLVDRGK